MRRVAFMMKDEGYVIVPTTDPGDIRNFSQKGVKMLFVFDDICGNYSLNMYAFEMWSQKSRDIRLALKEYDIKIISTCRLEIYQNANFKELTVLNDCICNLSSPDLELKCHEKMKIALKYFKEDKHAIEAVNTLSKYDCFPFLCSLFNKEKHDFDNFLKNPFKFYEKELDSLFHGREECKLKLCCLALCVVRNNNLTIDFLLGKVEQTRNIIDDILEECGLARGTSKRRLITSAENLLNSIFVLANECYKTIHDKLFDFLSCYMGSKMIDVLIKHGSSDFIGDRLVCGSKACNVCKRDEFDILVKDNHVDAYAKRLTDDLLDLKNIHVLSKHLKCSTISTLLFNSLQAIPEEKQKALISMRDKLGRSILFHSCQAGNLNFTRWMLHIGANIYNSDRYGDTCLHIAASEGHKEVVCELLKKDTVFFNSWNNSRKTPLYLACDNGHLGIVELLLLKRANVIKSDRYGYTCLHVAASKGHTEVVRELLKKSKKTIDLLSNFGKTSLYLACKNGHVCTVKELLVKGADFETVDGDRNSCLHAAILNDHQEVVFELLKQDTINIHSYNRNKETPLLLACKKGNVNIVKKLLMTGSDFNVLDFQRNSCVHVSASAGHTEVVCELAKQDTIQIDSNNDMDETPLYLACKNGCVNVLKELLRSGADLKNKIYNSGKSPLSAVCLNYQNRFDISPISAASLKGHVEVIRVLLQKNLACIDISDEHGRTTLFYASQNGCLHIVKELLAWRAEVNKLDKDGNSPLHFTLEDNTKARDSRNLRSFGFRNTISTNQHHQRTEVACELLKTDFTEINLRNKDGQTPLHLACKHLYFAVAQELLKKGADVNIRNTDGNSPLLEAIELFDKTYTGHTMYKTFLLERSKLIDEMLTNDSVEINVCNKKGKTALHLACKNKNVKLVKQLILKNASTNILDNRGNSPLLIAAIHAREKVIEELMTDETIDIDACNNNENSLLHYACSNGLVTTVTKLLLRTALVNKVNNNGNSPLHLAAKRYQCKVVEQLLKEGNIDIDACNNQGQTPLQLASYQRSYLLFPSKNNLENSFFIVKALLQRGCNINKLDEIGQSPLHHASAYGGLEIVKELLRHKEININQCDKHGNTPLHLVCQNMVEKDLLLGRYSHMHKAIINQHDQCEDIVKELLKKDNIDIDVCNKKGESPLQLACRAGLAKMVNELLLRKVPVNKVNNDGDTLLHLAVQSSEIDVVERLLQEGAIEIDTCNKKGNSPLHLACMDILVKVVKELLSKKASVNKVNIDGDSPLHLAIQKESYNVVEELLKEDHIDIDVCNYQEQTPLQLALISTYDTYHYYYDDHGSDEYDFYDLGDVWPLMYNVSGSYTNYESIVLALLKKGCDINKADKDGRLPLHVASANGNVKSVRELLKHAEVDINRLDYKGVTSLPSAGEYGRVNKLSPRSIYVNKVDYEGDSPLHKAIINCKEGVVDELLKKDTIDLDVCNKKGNTPFHFACSKGLVNVVDELINRGASINKVNKDGDSPLHLAVENGSKDIVDQLLEIDNIELDICNKKGRTPLHLVLHHLHDNNSLIGGLGVYDEIKTLKLIAKGADINKCDEKGRSPLHMASEKGNLKIVQEMLKREDININLCNPKGCTPLKLAKQRGFKDVVDQLLSRGAHDNDKEAMQFTNESQIKHDEKTVPLSNYNEEQTIQITNE